MKTTYTAFDCVTQTWVRGEEARKLRIHQVTNEIELLKGVRGEEYARFIKVTDRHARITQLETEMSRLLW